MPLKRLTQYWNVAVVCMCLLDCAHGQCVEVERFEFLFNQLCKLPKRVWASSFWWPKWKGLDQWPTDCVSVILILLTLWKKLGKIRNGINFTTFVHLIVCICTRVHHVDEVDTYEPQCTLHVWESEDGFSAFSMWVLGTKLRASALVTSAFMHWTGDGVDVKCLHYRGFQWTCTAI